MILVIVVGLIAFGYGIWYAQKSYKLILLQQWDKVTLPILMTSWMFSTAIKAISYILK
jgi:hypothetical protein